MLTRKIQKHPFHMVTPSPWPLCTSLALLSLVVGLVQYMHFFKFGFLSFFYGLLLFLLCLSLWWRDVIREAVFQGKHTRAVQRGLLLGMSLFILSEVLFFFSLFWAYFHMFLDPSVQIGCLWPPMGISPIISLWPIVNTCILMTSSVALTYAHYALITGCSYKLREGLLVTIFLALLFTSIQLFEYRTAAFGISDGVYGSVFYFLTGFHGFHVIIGTIYIIVCYFRRHQFTRDHHVGLETAAWYWHFVDVVWLYVFLVVYYYSLIPNIAS